MPQYLLTLHFVVEAEGPAEARAELRDACNTLGLSHDDYEESKIDDLRGMPISIYDGAEDCGLWDVTYQWQDRSGVHQETVQVEENNHISAGQEGFQIAAGKYGSGTIKILKVKPIVKF